MNKALRIALILLGAGILAFLLFLFLGRISVNKYSRLQEQHYENLVYEGILQGTITFKYTDCRKNNELVFTPEDCLEIMKEYKDKYGPLLALYDMEFKLFPYSQSEYYTGIIFSGYSGFNYTKLEIDGYRYRPADDMMNVAYYSEYKDFKTITIAGAMIVNNDTEDLSFIESACKESKIIIDKRTYESMMNSTVVFNDKPIVIFGNFLEALDPQNLEIVEEDLIEYYDMGESWA